MGEWVTIKATDDHEISAYVAKPAGEPVGALVVVQEIFGVNASIRDVADAYAKEGFVAIAPGLFDRMESGLQLGYDEEGMKKAFSLYPKLDPKISLKDIAGAFAYVSGTGKGTGVLGFCYGGLMSWLSATEGPDLGMKPACTVGYYAGGIGKVAEKQPCCPVMLHFGADDDHIGADQRDAVTNAHPEVEVYVYEGAGHAFANPYRSSYVAEAAKLADARSLKFLHEHIG